MESYTTGATAHEHQLDVPSDLMRELRAAGVDLDRVAKEGFFVGLYRRGDISQARLSAILGLDRFETDAVLKRHGIEYGPTLQEFLGEGPRERPSQAPRSPDPRDPVPLRPELP